ncbi:hypothetical protein LCGC14_0362570 [marine sediment metagenome]|uniref:Uncharacterized protein n=1 Tax=marine sediment metagenome TaxID=412755 RepID=A0A0F9TDR2_9ZZZZ
MTRRHDPFEQCLKEVTSDKAKREISVNRNVVRVLVHEIVKDDPPGTDLRPGSTSLRKRPKEVTQEQSNKILRYARRVLREVLN